MRAAVWGAGGGRVMGGGEQNRKGWGGRAGQGAGWGSRAGQIGPTVSRIGSGFGSKWSWELLAGSVKGSRSDMI